MDVLKPIINRTLFLFPPENAHGLSILALKYGLVARPKPVLDKRLSTTVAGMEFPNPLGFAAGYDKNGEVPDAILKLGFGFAEIGTVTPRPQAGNPQPRLFRLPEDEGVINRLGFNNQGHDAMLARLKARGEHRGIIGINIGANKDSEDFVADYVSGIEKFYDKASYFTANISSPNTPGLRNLQAGEALKVLLDRVMERAELMAVRNGVRKPVFLKIAPDLEQSQMDEIAGVVEGTALDGLVISNTTLDRSGLANQQHRKELGGLSGRPLFDKSTRVLAQMRNRIGPEMPIIGVGGIDSARQAITKLEAGANLIQLYTGMIFNGPGLPGKIVSGILKHLEMNNIAHISQLSGTRTKEWCNFSGEND